MQNHFFFPSQTWETGEIIVYVSLGKLYYGAQESTRRIIEHLNSCQQIKLGQGHKLS